MAVALSGIRATSLFSHGIFCDLSSISLTGSPTINDFGATTNMGAANVERFRKVLLATEFGNTDDLHQLGISDSELADIKFFLDKLIATGFIVQR